MTDERDYRYGLPIGDPRHYPRGPAFIRQPNNTVFSVASRDAKNDVFLRCIADGWPTPKYKWFKESYLNDTLIEVEINPLQDTRLTVSGGQFILHDPNLNKDRGRYFCKASNKFGTIRSKSVSISFGFIGEFPFLFSSEMKAVQSDLLLLKDCDFDSRTRLFFPSRKLN